MLKMNVWITFFFNNGIPYKVFLLCMNTYIILECLCEVVAIYFAVMLQLRTKLKMCYWAQNCSWPSQQVFIKYVYPLSKLSSIIITED